MIPPVSSDLSALACFEMYSYGASMHYYFAGDSVYFSNCSKNATQYQWLVNDTLHSTDSNFTFQFTYRDRHYITLNAISGSDTVSRTKSLMAHHTLPTAMKIKKITLLEWVDTNAFGVPFDTNSTPDVTFAIFQKGQELFRSSSIRTDPWQHAMMVFDQDGGLPFYCTNLADDLQIKFFDFDHGVMENWDEMYSLTIKPIPQFLYYDNVFEIIAPYSIYHAKIEWEWAP